MSGICSEHQGHDPGCSRCTALLSEEYIDGLREARRIVERQTDLTELVHFERPSDYRKGVLTCLMALDQAVADAIAKGSQDE